MRLTPRHAALHDAFRYTLAAILALILALAVVYGTLLFVASQREADTQISGEYSEADKMQILAGLHSDSNVEGAAKEAILNEIAASEEEGPSEEEKRAILQGLK